MSETYTKLFNTITNSTIWCEPDQTRIVWITMLALADRHGYVGASIPGLAHLARVPIEACEAAIATLLAPDKHSRSQEFEGRRIEVADRGWNLLNYERFRDMRDEEARREWERVRKRKARAKAKEDDVPDSPQMSHTVPPSCPTMSAQAEAESEAEAEAEEERSSFLASSDSLKRALDQRALNGAHFARFWSSYPKRIGKKACKAKWKLRKLDGMADAIIADIEKRMTDDRGWRAGFIPNPLTYLNGDRWEDEIQEERPQFEALSDREMLEWAKQLSVGTGGKTRKMLAHELEEAYANQATPA